MDAFKCAIRGSLLGVVLVVVACGEPASTSSPPAQGVRESADAVGATEAPGPTEIVIAWKGAASGVKLSSSDVVVAELTSRVDDARTVRLIATSSGLDGRLVQRDLGSVSLAARERRDVRVALDELPIQSETSTAFVSVIAELDRGDRGMLRIPTEPLYYQFMDDYRRARLLHAEDVLSLPNGGVLAQNPIAVTGRVLGDDGAFHDVALGGSAFTAHPVIGLTGARAVAADSPEALAFSPAAMRASEIPSLDERPSYALTQAAAVATQVCATYRVQYIDSGLGEDGLANTSVWQDVAAGMQFVQIRRSSDSAIVWSGNLNAAGCATPSLPAGSYFLSQAGDISWNGISILVRRWDTPHSVLVSDTWNTSFTTDGSGTTINLHPTFNNETVQASAVASEILKIHALWEAFGGAGRGLGLLPGTYNVQVNHTGVCGIQPPTDSCYLPPGADYVSIGTTAIGGTPTAHWKFVIAHEFGHNVSNRAAGNFFYDYTDNSATQPLCRCDHYDANTWGNREHCMQSREQTGAAQEEALAHWFSMRVFNNPNDTTAAFGYYKPILIGTNPQNILFPPVNVAPYVASSWMEINNCAAPSKGIEMDWYRFYSRISTSSSANFTTFPQLFEIYKRACTGSPTTKCSGQTVTWFPLLSAASNEFGGTSDARYIRFRNTGIDNGADH